jgi:hypothetical protein
LNKNKTLISAIIGVLIASSLVLAIDSAVAMPAEMMDVSNRPVSASWIRINGVINHWGTTDVRGQIQTQARTALLQSTDTRQLASASAIWTTNTSRAIQSVRAKENFTYVFYAARLLNASISTLSTGSSDSDYVIGGTWNLATVKANITIITNEVDVITRVLRHQDVSVEKVEGQLTITKSWSEFTLNLNGKDPLTGLVFRSMTRQMQFNQFKITDDSISNTVTRADIKAVAQCYGDMPGWGSYDTRMDFNNNFRVDIADISTVAANL